MAVRNTLFAFLFYNWPVNFFFFSKGGTPVDVLSLLLDYNAEWTIKSKSIARLLLKHGIDPRPALNSIAESSNGNCAYAIALLLNNSPDVDVGMPLSFRPDCRSLLHVALASQERDNLGSLATFLRFAKKATLSSTDKGIYNPLLYAMLTILSLGRWLHTAPPCR